MRTRDHDLLGRFVLKRQDLQPGAVCRRLFLLGCVEPDGNPFSYARGSVKYRFFHGHNAENVREHLAHMLEKLCESGVYTPRQWFRFGVTLHYLADSFTFAHNRRFTGTLRDHRTYEERLHAAFVEYLQTADTALALPFDGDDDCHARYLAEQPSCRTDCRYILGTALGVCRMLPIDRQTVGKETDRLFSPGKRAAI